MPRPAVIAVVVLGVVALLVSTAFALVRSGQLVAAEAELAELRTQLGAQAGGRSGPDADADDEAPANPLDDLLDGEGGALGDLFSEDGSGLDGLFGDDTRQLAQCIQQAGAPGAQDLPSGPAGDQIARIAALVEQLRALPFDDDPAPEFLDDGRIRDRVTREVREGYAPEDAADDRDLLAALGAVPPDLDLIALQTDLLTGQVAGFYDLETGELVVRGEPTASGLDATAQTVVAHELQHALADQAFGIPRDVMEDVDDGDAALAALSVVEGDATLTQQQFAVVGLSVSEQLALAGDPDALAAQRQLADVPHYVAQSLNFPYLAGLRFVCDRYAEDGWGAVDAVYDALPTTTAEIMDPARYPAPAVDTRDPGALGGDWERRRTTTLGAADLLWLFEAPGGDTSAALDDPRSRALDWTGGELQLWRDGDASAVGVALTEEPDGALCDALVTWYERAFPEATDAPTRREERMVREQPDRSAVIACAEGDVRLGIAPDLETARALVR